MSPSVRIHYRRPDRGTTVTLMVPLTAGQETEKKGEDSAGTDR